MNVGCPECASIFRVDPAKVPAGGVRARCSICGGVIPVPEPSSADRGETTGSFRRQPTPLPPPHEFTTPAAPFTTSPFTTAPPPPSPPAPPPPYTESGEMTPPMGLWQPAETEPAPAPATPQLPPLEGMYTPTEPMRAAPEPAFTPPPLTPPPFTPPLPQEPDASPAPPAPETPTTTVTGSHVNPYLTRDPHARARRLARALVSDIVVYYRDKHEEALRAGDVREEFRDEIKKSYEDYVSQVGAELAESTTYFQDALNEVLARGKRIF